MMMEPTPCQTCGTLLPPDATQCPTCGATPFTGGGAGQQPSDAPQAPPPPPAGDPAATGLGADPGGAASPSSDAKNLALLAHLSAFVMFIGIPSVIGPLVVWLIKRDQDRFIAAHALEALNFNLSLLLYSIAATVLAVFTLGLALLLIIPLALVVAVAWFILVIIAGMAASRGEQYRYPLTIRLVK
jgi:uncharacterized protein